MHKVCKNIKQWKTKEAILKSSIEKDSWLISGILFKYSQDLLGNKVLELVRKKVDDSNTEKKERIEN